MILLIVSLVLTAINYASCLFEDCDHNYTLNLDNELDINSPGYPDFLYHNGSSCRYFVETQLDYAIELDCYVDVDEVHGVNFSKKKN